MTTTDPTAEGGTVGWETKGFHGSAILLGVSQENVEIVRTLHAAFDEIGMERVRAVLIESDDIEEFAAAIGGLDELMELIDPDIEVRPLAGQFSLPDTPTSGRYRGREGWLTFWRQWLEPWEDWRYEIGNFADHGDDVVLDLKIRARGRGSGVPVDVRLSQVWTVRAGRIVGLAVFDTRAEALKAAGFSQYA